MKKDDNLYKYFLHDFISLLIEDAREAKTDAKKTPNEFNNGKLLAYYEVMDTLKNQLIAFNIKPEDLDTEPFDPDKELI